RGHFEYVPHRLHVVAVSVSLDELVGQSHSPGTQSLGHQRDPPVLPDPKAMSTKSGELQSRAVCATSCRYSPATGFTMTDKNVWFVTGAGRGMGVDIVKAALAEGHAVVATGRNTHAVTRALGEADD